MGKGVERLYHTEIVRDIAAEGDSRVSPGTEPGCPFFTPQGDLYEGRVFGPTGG